MEDYQVHVTKIDHGEVANQIHGYIIYRSERLRFRAIAYGRYGGQNVYPKLGRKARETLRKLGLKEGEFLDDLQRRLIYGDVILHVTKPPDF